MKKLAYTPGILLLLGKGQKLQAIKMAKDLYGLSLDEAKNMINSYRPGGSNFYILEQTEEYSSAESIVEDEPIDKSKLITSVAEPNNKIGFNNPNGHSNNIPPSKFIPKPDSVSQAYFQNTPKTIDYSKCPFCGSSNFEQSNKASNFVLSRGIALGFKALTGMSGSASGLEDTLDRVYQCDNCHRKWTSWENPTDLPSDQWNLNKTIEDITNNAWKFETNEQVMRFSWHVDLIINNDDAYTPSNSIKARFYFLKQFACMQYIINTYKRDFDYERDFEYYVDHDMHYRAGLTFAQYSLELENYGENLLCFLITSYITQTIGETSKDDLEEALSRCVIPNDTSSFIFQRDYWEGIIEWINCLKK